MKKVDEVKNTLTRKDLDHALLKEYVNALKNEEFKATVAKLGIKEKVAMKYTSKLERTTKELEHCAKCKSLHECKNTINGCVYFPHQEQERLRFDYVVCKYKKEQMEIEKNRSTCFDVPLAIEEAKMGSIDLTDKKRVEVIKWAKKFYKDYQNDKHLKGLYLHGSFGSGKSYILAALLNELAKCGAKTVIAYYPEVLRKLKEFNDDYIVIMEQLKKCDCLLLDDMGAESVTNWNRDEILGTILQYRMDAKLPTFITSNLNIEQLEAHLSNTKSGTDVVKAKRIIERIKQLTEDLELISENRRR